jgi:hypothetical protein
MPNDNRSNGEKEAQSRVKNTEMVCNECWPWECGHQNQKEIVSLKCQLHNACLLTPSKLAPRQFDKGQDAKCYNQNQKETVS